MRKVYAVFSSTGYCHTDTIEIAQTKEKRANDGTSQPSRKAHDSRFKKVCVVDCDLKLSNITSTTCVPYVPVIK